MIQRTTLPTMLALLLGALAPSIAAGAADPPLKLWVRDALTGMAVPGAKAGVAGPGKTVAIEAQADRSGRLSLPDVKSAASIEVSARGYRSLTIAPSRMGAGATATTVWLLPRSRPEELRPEVLAARQLPNATLLHGHVVDVETGRPVPGASALLAGAGTKATTDRSGYFRLYAKGTQVATPETVPDFADLVVSAPGFTSVRLVHIALIEGDFHYVVDLEPGSGETVRDMSHKLYPLGFRPPDELGGSEEPEPRILESLAEPPGTADDLLAELSGASPAKGLGLVTAAATAGGLQVVNPPDQIFVSGFGFFPLEVYVANGLCSEWIASWNFDALFAGSIAYRSYGSWFQINQGSICATTSCQVFQNTFNSRCDTAAQRTTGILLQRGGVVARSEYSAENNSLRCANFSCVNTDLSCGDGSAGSPAAGWPCLSDSHLFDQGTGHCCFGHGRGMCQWGTQAWSRSARLWNWMTDHYYNANGAGSGSRTMFMTSPFDIVGASASSTSVARGTTFTISETLRSFTDWNQPQIMLGASLIGPTAISDPAHDTKVTVLARTSFSVQSRDTAVSRLFTVPSTATVGTYDLLVAIWFDANGNGVIDGNDKPLRTLRFTGLITVR
jgi:stage II sporulation SpoD-like protein